MIDGVALAVYALFAATAGPLVLRRARWTSSAPRVAILSWQALVWSVFAAIVLAGLALWMPQWPGAVGLAEYLHTCVMLLRQQYATPGGAIASTLGLAIAGAVVARAGWCLIRSWLSVGVRRRSQRRSFRVAARREPDSGTLILDHDRAAAFCLPGRRPEVVITTGALACLDEEQVGAVLAHERAHLRGHHDRIVGVGSALAEAFPFVPAFRIAAVEITRLVELAADDAAARCSDRLTLATALVRLAEGSVPTGTLAAGGPSAVARVRRLVEPTPCMSMLRKVGLLAGAGVIAVTPVALVAAPAITVAASDYCPVTSSV